MAFVVAAWVSLLISFEFAAGPSEAGPFYLPLVVMLIGAIRVTGGVAGGRVLLAVGDLGVAIELAARLAFTKADFLEASPAWLVAATGLVLAAGASTLLLPPAIHGRITRQSRDRRLLVALVVIDVVAVIGIVALDATQVQIDVGQYLVQLASTTIGFDLAVFGAWWLGVRWPIALGGLAALIQVIAAGERLFDDPVRATLALAPNLLAVVAFAVGPMLVLPALQAAGSDAHAIPPRSRIADVWIGLAAAMWPLLALFGQVGIGISDLCLECGPGFPGDGLLQSVGLLTISVVPLSALVVVARGASRSRGVRVFLGILLLSVAVLAVEVVAGWAGYSRFALVGVATPVVLLMGLGAGVGLVRPRPLAHAGWVAALGSAGLVTVWSLGLRGGSTFSNVEPIFIAASMGEIAVASLAVARESSRTRRLGQMMAVSDLPDAPDASA